MHRWCWLEINVIWKRREWSQWIAADCWQNSWVSVGAIFKPLCYLNGIVFYLLVLLFPFRRYYKATKRQLCSKFKQHQ